MAPHRNFVTRFRHHVHCPYIIGMNSPHVSSQSFFRHATEITRGASMIRNSTVNVLTVFFETTGGHCSVAALIGIIALFLQMSRFYVITGTMLGVERFWTEKATRGLCRLWMYPLMPQILLARYVQPSKVQGTGCRTSKSESWFLMCSLRLHLIYIW